MAVLGMNNCPFCDKPLPHDVLETGIGTRGSNARRGWFRVHLERCSGLMPLPTRVPRNPR